MFWGKSCTLIYVFAIENFLVINMQYHPFVYKH